MRTQPETLCMGCMEPAGGDICPKCGWSETSYSPPPLYLRPRTILDGRYLLGKVLGAGGFGITYLGWDLDLGMKLAIKEYFPSTYGARDPNHSTVIPSTAQGRKLFDQGLSRFLEEGQAFAKFQGHPGITSVLTFVRQNGTSYLVMRYEDGITLQEYLRKRGGRVDYEQAMRLAMPVMDSLRAVHEAGILHRDISPDNIFINRGGQVKILDFGSAKHDLANQNQSTMMTLKRGYSPEEQYRSNGKVGPWTDIYAVGATIYQAITGQIPPESLDRLHDDQLQPPSKLGVQLPRPAEAAIMRALSVRAASRFQTMKDFQDALVSPGILDEPVIRETQPRETRWHVWAAVIAAMCLVALAAIAMIPPRILRFDAAPAAITAGQPTALHWSVDRGSVSIEPGVGRLDETNGERSLSPPATTTYTLTARRFLRSVTRSVVVVVSPVAAPKPVHPKPSPYPDQPKSAPYIASFTADPVEINQGQSSTLKWLVEGDAQSLFIMGIGRVEPSGMHQVSPQATTTYSLTVKGPAGADLGTVTVKVNRPASPKPAPSSDNPPVTVSPPPVLNPPNPAPSSPVLPGVLHIEVVDEKGQSMAALIQIDGSGPTAYVHLLRPTHSGITEGEFKPGSYKLKVTAPGYVANETSAVIASGVPTPIQIHMAKLPAN